MLGLQKNVRKLRIQLSLIIKMKAIKCFSVICLFIFICCSTDNNQEYTNTSVNTTPVSQIDNTGPILTSNSTGVFRFTANGFF